MEITYQGPRMKGATSLFQQWSIPPLSSNQYWGPNDVIKIMGNITQGLVDFYRTHIQFTVKVDQSFQPIGCIQIDNSAQSIISQTVLLSNQAQIERIQQYDTLACALTDLGFSQYVCQSRSGEGLGYNNIQTSQPVSSVRPTQFALGTAAGMTGLNAAIQYQTAGFSPIIAPQYSGGGYMAADTDTSSGFATMINTVQSGLTGGSFQSLGNWVTFPNSGTNGKTSGNGPNIYSSQTGRALAVRAQYLLGTQNNGYPDSPFSQPLTAPVVKNQVWNYSNMTTTGFSAAHPYQTAYGVQMPSVNNYISLASPPCGVVGYNKPLTPQFCVGTNEPYLSATIPQVQMAQGQILATPIPLTTKTFRVPLISAILGVLIPPDQFQLIPADALKNLILQITLNPFAFFTSGYSDIHQLDSTGMQPQNMQKRIWQITSFQWVWHLYTFPNQSLQEGIKQKLYSGINISSNLWMLAAQYQLPNGSYVRNTFQIPVNVDSLSEVMIIFLSNQYQSKTFCRKQFRLSNCITALQLKANGNWYPLQPITGNAGNPQAIDTSGDNWNFYELMLLSNNFLFNTNFPYPKINTKNFAINGRIYNVNDTRTCLGSSLYGTSPNGLDQASTVLNSMNTNSINASTAMGQSWFHQNRYVGKGLYTYSFQPYGHSKGYINGINTRDFRQFEIIFNNSPQGVFPSDQTMLIFARCNVIVRYSPNGIQVVGT